MFWSPALSESRPSTRISRRSSWISLQRAIFLVSPPCSTRPRIKPRPSRLKKAVCLEVDRNDIAILLERKPHAGMDMFTVLGRQFHASQQLVRVRANRNPNDIIEEDMASASGSPTASPVLAGHGHSSSFSRSPLPSTPRSILSCRRAGMGSLSFHPAEPVPLNARRYSGTSDHDESEPAGYQRSPARRARL